MTLCVGSLRGDSSEIMRLKEFQRAQLTTNHDKSTINHINGFCNRTEDDKNGERIVIMSTIL